MCKSPTCVVISWEVRPCNVSPLGVFKLVKTLRLLFFFTILFFTVINYWVTVWGHAPRFISRLPHATVLRWQTIVWSGELLKAACRCVTPVQHSAMKWRVCCLQTAISAGYRYMQMYFLNYLNKKPSLKCLDTLIANWLFKRECIMCSKCFNGSK